ncbi:MAG TPA: hypothetical protein VJH91_02085 [Candidatus Paceibacterota bacterium]
MLSVVRSALESLQREVGTIEFEVVSCFARSNKLTGAEPLVREACRVAEMARCGARADIGIGISSGNALFLVNSGARRVMLPTHLIVAVVGDGPISLAIPTEIDDSYIVPLAKALGPTYDTLQGPGCAEVENELYALAGVAVGAWSGMNFPIEWASVELLH